MPILLPVAVLLLPSLDLVLAVVRRSRAGQKWSQPDTMHLHHRLLAIGHSHAHAVLIMYLWTAVLTLGAASFAFMPARGGDRHDRGRRRARGRAHRRRAVAASAGPPGDRPAG